MTTGTPTARTTSRIDLAKVHSFDESSAMTIAAQWMAIPDDQLARHRQLIANEATQGLASAAAYVECTTAQSSATHISGDGSAIRQLLAEGSLLQHAISQSHTRGTAVTTPITQDFLPRDSESCFTAISFPGYPSEAFVLLHSPQFTRSALLLASAARSVSLREKLWHRCQMDHQATTNACAAVELCEKVAASDTLDEAYAILASVLHDHLTVDRVAVVDLRLSQVRAISDVDNPATHSELCERLNTLASECEQRAAITSWPPLPGSNASDAQHPISLHTDARDTLTPAESAPTTEVGLREHRLAAKQHGIVLSLPLRNPKKFDDVFATVILFCKAVQRERFLNLAHFGNAIIDPLGAVLSAKRKAEPHPIAKALSTVRSWLSDRRGKVVAIGCAAALMLSAMPIPYHVSCRGTMEAKATQMAVTPFDGVLAETLVRPGDQVEQGDILARMDASETRWELNGIQAEIARYETEWQKALAEANPLDSQMAQSELQRLQSRQHLLEERLNHIEIRSSSKGVVLTGLQELRENVPVDQGQALFEIASTNELRVDIELPVAELESIRCGQPVDIKIDGLPRFQATGSISRIRPRAEIVDGHNVVIAEVTFEQSPGESSDQVIKPGMKALLQVHSDRHPIYWIVLHRTWEQLTKVW